MNYREQKKKGMLYSRKSSIGSIVIVLCCEDQEESVNMFSGIVVCQTDPTSTIKIGDCSVSWAASSFGIYDGILSLDNSDWEPQLEYSSTLSEND